MLRHAAASSKAFAATCTSSTDGRSGLPTTYVEGLSSCCNDLEDLLRRYSDTIEDLLAEPSQVAQRFLEEEDELPINLKSLQALATRWREDRVTMKQAADWYRAELNAEQDRWLLAEAALVDSHALVQQQEVEAVIRRYRMPGRQGENTLVSAVLDARDQHLGSLTRLHESKVQNTGDTDEDAQGARSDWTSEVCRAVTTDCRQNWQKGQSKVLEATRMEFKEERIFTLEALQKHVHHAEQVGHAIQIARNGQLQRAQDELDQVNATYKAGLRAGMEAKLRETKQHATEQAEFFQREIQEALEVEQAEEALHSAQLRRMRLAILKWSHDYMRDARVKAKDVTDRRKALRKHDPSPESQAALVEGDALANNADQEADQPEDDEQSKQSKQSMNSRQQSQKTLSSVPEAIGSRSVPHALGSEQQRLSNSKRVLTRIWEKLPSEEDTARNFLSRVESSVPFTDEVLAIYEDYLEEHGLLPALHASEFAEPGREPDGFFCQPADGKPERSPSESEYSANDKEMSEVAGTRVDSRTASEAGDRARRISSSLSEGLR